MSRRGLVLVVALVAVVAIGWAGVVMAHVAADRSRDRSVSLQAATDLEDEAHLFWDNPFQRLLYLALSMTKATPRLACPTYEVTAYTVFGAEIDHVFVNCTGAGR